VGTAGSVEILQLRDSLEEAKAIADCIEQWIAEGLAPSEIAVLISRQPELYARHLSAELVRRRVPFRNEQSLQDLAAEPVAQLIVDFLRVIIGEREADAYEQLMNVLLATGLDEDDAYSIRARWHRFIEQAREHMKTQFAGATLTAKALHLMSDRFIAMVGQETLTGLSADYEQGERVAEVIAQTYERIAELLILDSEPLAALYRFSGENAVRIMTIHKSKGLEFDSVVMLGVEQQTYWGKIADERSIFFVGISRAKRHLVLTVAKERERPDGFQGRWDTHRAPHAEFLGYARTVIQ